MIASNNRTTGVGTQTLRSRWLATAAFCTLGFALLLTGAAGCGPSERQRVQTVSDQFLDAMSQENWSRAKPLLTEKGRDAMGSVNPFADDSETGGEKQAASSPRTETYTVGEPKIDDTLAAVPVTLVSGDQTQTSLGTLRLRREDGEWRVRALRIEGEDDSPGITLDFENPGAALLGAAFRAVGEGIGEMLKGIGQGMGAFMEGIEKGAAAMEKAQSGNSPEATESPAPSPGSDGSVKIEEHPSGS